MIQRWLTLSLACFLTTAPLVGQEEQKKDAKAKDITTQGGKIGDLLRQWWKEGTAAGHTGDYYDNRDGAHSDFDSRPYPQMQRIEYSKQDIAQRKHWAAQRVLVPHVVFGNSSTSAPPTQGGSNPRQYYSSPGGLAFLYKQYTSNNLYVYPEHRDHDPGHNGPDDGFGDIYPTNTPYLLISQGSSGSDQVFLQALAPTLAAFRPEVKKKLVDKGLLMPTLQYLLRRTANNVKSEADYLTGIAHPTVFEGNNINALGMVQAAHDLKVDEIPPLAHLQVLEEAEPERGRDFFEPAGFSEKLADTPCAIARLWRGRQHSRRLVVSAAKSSDANDRPLTFTWVVLRGDKDKIQIKPRGPERAEAEIIVSYHPRRPIAFGNALESNRVDIGVFAHNGKHPSAPAFITLYSFDHESRAYDEQGKLLEIGNSMGMTRWHIDSWTKALETLAKDEPAGIILALKVEDRKILEKAHLEYPPLHNAMVEAEKFLRLAEKERAATDGLVKKLEAEKDAGKEAALKEARQAQKDRQVEEQTRRKTWEAARTAATAYLDRAEKGQPTPRRLVEDILQRSTRRPGLFQEHADYWTPGMKKAGKPLELEKQRLNQLGIAEDGKDGWQLTPLRRGKDAKDSLWTDYERAQLERFHAQLISQLVLPGAVRATYALNFADFRLASVKEWRDVQRYDAKGRWLGWTRFSAAGPQQFNHDGLLILTKDDLGRCVTGKTVRYEIDGKRRVDYNQFVLQATPAEIMVTYEFAGPADWFGTRKP